MFGARKLKSLETKASDGSVSYPWGKAALGCARMNLEKGIKEKKPILRAEGLKIKGIVVYDTSYGNTKKIAETIADTLKESGIEVDLFDVKDVKRPSAKDYNFLVLGSPTKFGTMSLAIRFFLGKVKKKEWMNKPFAAFDTENPENIEKKGAQPKRLLNGLEMRR